MIYLEMVWAIRFSVPLLDVAVQYHALACDAPLALTTQENGNVISDVVLGPPRIIAFPKEITLSRLSRTITHLLSPPFEKML